MLIRNFRTSIWVSFNWSYVFWTCSWLFWTWSHGFWTWSWVFWTWSYGFWTWSWVFRTWSYSFWTWSYSFWTWSWVFWTLSYGFWTWSWIFWTWSYGFWTWSWVFWTWSKNGVDDQPTIKRNQFPSIYLFWFENKHFDLHFNDTSLNYFSEPLSDRSKTALRSNLFNVMNNLNSYLITGPKCLFTVNNYW